MNVIGHAVNLLDACVSMFCDSADVLIKIGTIAFVKRWLSLIGGE